MPRAFDINWLNVVCLAAVHVVSVLGLVAYVTFHGVSLAAIAILVVGGAATMLSISAGYHRLFSHRSYETGALLRFLLLVGGASAFQNTAINWAADHRRHHRYIDSPRDPYDAGRGFWYSHLLWVVESTTPATQNWPVPDLQANRLLAWQHRHYVAIGTVSGFLVPGVVGCLLGDLWGGLLFGGAIRLLLCYHATFSINSLAHLFGTQPYSEANSSRDSWPTALITLGEGYHNYHHTFPADYRNGVAWHHFDPSKWLLYLLDKLGLVWGLRRTPAPAIARAKLRTEYERATSRKLNPGVGRALEMSHGTAQASLARWAAADRRQRGSDACGRRRLQEQWRLARGRYRWDRRAWLALLRRYC